VGWLLAILAGFLGLWSASHWLNQIDTANLVWLWLTTLIMTGGIVTHLYQRRKAKLTVCSVKSQIRPLQVTCLAVQALGVQWLWYRESPDFAALWPFLAWPGWPYVCIIGGVLGLGWLSLFCDCRDEALGTPYANRSV
jgi:hypothetical protein